MAGPLAGLKIIEIAALGPCPFAAMLLADMGAEVIRIDRPGGGEIMGAMDKKYDVLSRGRRSVVIDLKSPEGSQTLLRLIDGADILLEGFRPGVMERLGLGPEVCLEINPKLVYGRMTGWGQYGPLAQAAGHDINYIALVGALHACGVPDQPPAPPLNLVGDFGGGAMFLIFGVLSALYEAQKSGKGQVVDTAMTDGTALLTAMTMGFKAAGQWNNQRGTNLNDGGAHYYGAYECADGKFISIASAEKKFYQALRDTLGLSDPQFNQQNNPQSWPVLKEKLAAIFKTKTRAAWCELMEGTDICFAPVLNWDEAPLHPHNVARKTYFELDGVVQPSPAPRFSRTPSEEPKSAPDLGSDTDAVLSDAGFSAEQIAALKRLSVVG